MLRREWAEVFFPHQCAVMIECEQHVVRGFGATNVNALAVHRRRGTGGSVISVLAIRHQRKVLLPELATVGGLQAEHREASGFVVAGRDKNLIAPQHRRGVAGAGQGNLPIEIRVTPLRRNRLRVADAAAVWAAETRPLLRVALQRSTKTQGDGEIEARDSSHSMRAKLPQRRPALHFKNAATFPSSSFSSSSSSSKKKREGES